MFFISFLLYALLSGRVD